MADIVNFRAESAFDDPRRMGGMLMQGEDKALELDADAQEAQRLDGLHQQLMAWLAYEVDVQAPNRYQMAVDEDFYDGLQWTQEDAQVLMDRGQAPLVFNLVKPALNWLMGTEKRTRVDFNVLPREQGDEAGAEVKTKLLKYLSDVNRTVWSRSEAFASAVKAGIGWLEDGVTREPGRELVYSGVEDWRNVWYDSNSIKLDLADARYLFRQKWIDADFSEAMFPAHKHLLRGDSLRADERDGVTGNDSWYMGQRVNIEVLESQLSPISKGIRQAVGHEGVRSRVRMVECWYRVPYARRVCRGAGFEGKDFVQDNPAMVAALACGDIEAVEHVGTQMRVCIFADGGVLYEGKSPYRHNEFPLTPVWCWRRKRDNAPYGVIRDIRDPQEDNNKRASKALYLLSVNRVVMDKDAVDDIEELREEVARPDSIIVKKRGSELSIQQDHQLAQEHLQLMGMDAAMIRNVSGITGESLGYDSNVISGKGILAKQEQGAVVSEDLFDHLRFAVQLQGEKQLALLEQFYTQAKVVRIVGAKGKPEWLELNKEDPLTGELLNDITATKADFVVDERDHRASVRQAMADQLTELLTKLPPQIGVAVLDLVVDAFDIPNKDEIVARIRKVTGQVDPWAEQTPEDQQQQAMAAQQQAAQQQVMTEQLQARAARDKAAAMKADAEALLKRLEALEKSYAVAGTAATMPQLAGMADSLVMAADQHGQPPAGQQQGV